MAVLKKTSRTTGNRSLKHTGCLKCVGIHMPRRRTGRRKEVRLRVSRIVAERVEAICTKKNWPESDYLQAIIQERTMQDYERIILKSYERDNPGHDHEEMDTAKLKRIIKDVIENKSKEVNGGDDK